MTHLPNGWTMATVGTLTEPVPKRAPTGSDGESFTYVDLSSVDQQLKQIVTPTDVPVVEAPSRARQVVATGDVLVSTVRPNLNGVATVPAELDGATASTGFCVLRPNPRTLDGRYLFHWVRSPRFISSMVRLSTGASYPAVSDRIVKSSAMPLPPLEEQRRIAAILDKADELRAKRRAALHQLDRIGAVVEVEDGRERLRHLVEDYVASARQGKSALIVSPTHIEGQDVTDALREQLKSAGQVAKEERQFLQLKNVNWTEEHKADPYHYRQRNLALEFQQNADGHIKGERWQVVKSDLPQLHALDAKDADGNERRINLGQASRFTVYQQQELALAAGDRLRVTKGGKTREGTRVNNGDLFTVTGFTKDGHIRLHTGKTLDRDFGHIAHGYVTTSHSAQGKTVDHVFIAQSSQSLPATSQQQFYVSISRGREAAKIYTDDKKALEKAVLQDGSRMTAREVAERESADRMRVAQKEARQKQSESTKSKEHGNGKSL